MISGIKSTLTHEKGLTLAFGKILMHTISDYILKHKIFRIEKF